MAFWIPTEGQMVNPVLILLFYKFSAEMNRASDKAKVLLSAKALLAGNAAWSRFSQHCSSNVLLTAGVLCRDLTAVSR